MNPLMKFLPEFENHLNAKKDKITDDLIFLINRESPNSNLRMFFFEYEHDDFTVVFWSVDKNGDTLTDTIALPIKDREDFYKLENYKVEMIPFSLTRAEQDVYEYYRNKDDGNELGKYWDYSEEYFDEKDRIFNNWFYKCWNDACILTNIKIGACLSIHDSIGGIDLNTGSYIDYEEINKRFD